MQGLAGGISFLPFKKQKVKSAPCTSSLDPIEIFFIKIGP
jgi:hypothetical protein